jgi:DnaJ-domain-containing protein 1
VVADAGSVEGMWRDPLGDLADSYFPDDRQQSYGAASGYLLLSGGRPLAVVKKQGAREDAWFLQEALARARLAPPPDPAERPGKTKKTASPRGAPRPPREPEPEPQARIETPVAVRAVDPWAVLGIAPGIGAADARKAFRTLIAQYHPDKVAHLAPEFQELADKKTRELLAAWELVQQALGG